MLVRYHYHFPSALLFLRLLLCFVMANGQFRQDCNFSQRLKTGEVYYIYNPDYPEPSRGRQSCKWIAESDYRVKLTCNMFYMRWSLNCFADRLAVHVNKSTVYSYCGGGAFKVESTGRLMTIELSTVIWSTGVKFLCELEAIEKSSGGNGCTCGWKKPSQLRMYEGTKIVGGVETEVNEYPMMAGLVDPEEKSVYCGATIISERHVITAAHCVYQRFVNNVGVLVGDHDITTGADTDASRLYTVSKFDIHPSYTIKTMNDDIAVVTVTSTINFSLQVGPVCLPFQHQSDSFAGNYVTLLGWGTTEFGGMKSNTLRKVALSVPTYGQCRSFYEDLKYNQICTYGRERDACQFDSGGPVLWQNPTTKRLVLVGIINYGFGCGSDKPGVNARVTSYLDWITYVTPGTAYCGSE